jgi:hypothetical protein
LIAFVNGSTLLNFACKGGIIAMKMEINAAYMGTVRKALIDFKTGLIFSQRLAKNAWVDVRGVPEALRR